MSTSSTAESPTSLYRFRSIDALLGKHKELENQEIYFAPPEQLNDPLEGFKDVFWKGDEILWQNLLKHYLLTLLYEVFMARVGGQSDPSQKETCFIRATEDSLPTSKMQDLFRRSHEIFNQHEDVHGFTASLARRLGVIKREELTTYLRALHFHALNSVLSAMEETPELFQRPVEDQLREASKRQLLCRQMSEHLEQAEQRADSPPGFAQALAKADGLVSLQQFLLAQFHTPDMFSANKSWQTVLIEYPAKYVRQLEQLLYSDWYTACFVENPAQAAMWGNYCDSHKGVCLQFDTPHNAIGQPTITFQQEIGLRTGKGGFEPVIGNAVHPLYKIQYKPKFVDIDFFRSLGTLNRPMLKFWLSNTDSQYSPRVTDILEESKEWRAEYWKNAVAAITTKLSDWAHEGEYRATLQSSIMDFSDPAKRKLKYRFQDLKGIIFGVKTPTADKLRIMQIVAEKCKQEGRTTFNFQQAFFSSETGKFAVVPLDLLQRICGEPSTDS